MTTPTQRRTDPLDDMDRLTLTEIRKLKQVAELYTMGNILAGLLVTLATIGGTAIVVWNITMGHRQ